MDEIDHDLEIRARSLAKAMVAGVDGDLKNNQDAILEMFRKVTAVIMALSDRVDHLSHEITPGRNLKPSAARPDNDALPASDDEAPGEMRKAQIVRDSFM